MQTNYFLGAPSVHLKEHTLMTVLSGRFHLNRARATEGNTVSQQQTITDTTNSEDPLWARHYAGTPGTEAAKALCPAFTKLTGTGASKKPHTNTAKPKRAHDYRTP